MTSLSSRKSWDILALSIEKIDFFIFSYFNLRVYLWALIHKRGYIRSWNSIFFLNSPYSLALTSIFIIKVHFPPNADILTYAHDKNKKSYLILKNCWTYLNWVWCRCYLSVRCFLELALFEYAITIDAFLLPFPYYFWCDDEISQMMTKIIFFFFSEWLNYCDFEKSV